MSALEELAPYPTTEQEATADNLIKYLAVRGYARDATLPSLTGNLSEEDYKAWSDGVALIVADFAAVDLLLFLKDFHRDVADDAARNLWQGWQDGGCIPELLYDCLTKYKIDPEKVIEAAMASEADAAVTA